MRSVRRAHRERLLARARARARTFLPMSSEKEVERMARHFLSAPKRCSCSMCGNIRRVGKGKERLTLEERVDWSEEVP